MRPLHPLNLFTILFLISLYGLPQWCSAAENAPIRVCGDRDPLSMTLAPQPDPDKSKQANLIGFSVDMIRAAFATMGKNVQFIDDLPWKRCLSEVQNGSIDFAMDAYFDLDRSRVFDYSTHYNTLTPQIFFLKSNPVDFSSLEKLKHYRGCGVLGTSYTHYGIMSKDLDLGIARGTLITKMAAHRCDYFLEELEDMASFKITGVDYLSDPTIEHKTIAWAVAPSKFLIAAKNSKNSAMMGQINSAIYSLIKSGQAERFWHKMKIDLPYRP